MYNTIWSTCYKTDCSQTAEYMLTCDAAFAVTETIDVYQSPVYADPKLSDWVYTVYRNLTLI